jgi:glutamyl-tRNA synthetase
MTESPAPRVRFAPSPTGYLHVGGARTALFNWLFARRERGVFILRIEDTDRERSSEEMTRAIVSALEWLELDVDEGPFHQADGLERHRSDVLRTLEAGAAYRCFCEPVAGGKSARAVGGCAGGCRDLDPGEAARRAEGGEPFAVRFRVPEGETTWNDAVHGSTSFPNDSLEDFILLRRDGTPVYNMAVVSDDIEMRITHVIRGDDHLSNTPKQILLYQALRADLPIFAHVPMILGPDGKRLSKRHGATSVEAYREEGILPEAMVNFLSLLGWSPGDDREVMTREELVEAFSLDRILRKSGVFDPDKLLWLNGQHMTHAAPERLVQLVGPRLLALGVPEDALDSDRARLLRVIEAVRERARTIAELARQAAPFLAPEIAYDEQAVRRFWKDPVAAGQRLGAERALLERMRDEDFEPARLEEALRGLAEERGEGAGKLIHPLRVALMGVGVGPGIFLTLSLMGRERTLERIDAALAYLRAETPAE